jgi:hypothetical protein
MLKLETLPSKDCCLFGSPYGFAPKHQDPPEGNKPVPLQPIVGVVGLAIDLMLAETFPGGK